tara:strand:+ start:327 stop:542 length:216 start_codon:yes stop_codon:yes gene_type:complete
MKRKQHQQVILNLGRKDSPATQEAVATLDKVQKELQKRTHLRVSRAHTLQVLIKHWQETKGDDYGIRYLWI